MRAAAARLEPRDAGLLAAVPLWLWWAVWQGGSPVSVWAVGLVYLAVAGALLAALVPRPPLGRPALWALAAALGLLAWSCASIAWADDRGLAWIACARLGLVVAALALPLLWPPTRGGLILGVAALVGCALLGEATALIAARSDPTVLGDGRLTDPTGYANASAALLFMAALASLPLAVDARLARRARGLALGAAVALAGGALLAQSRASLGALAVALAALLALSARRGALALAAGVVALALAAIAGPLLDVRAAWLRDDDGGAVGGAILALLGAGAVVALAGIVLSRFDAPRSAPDGDARAASPRAPALRRPPPALIAAGCAALLAGALLAGGAGWLADRAHDIATPDYDRLEVSSTRFTGDLGSNRVDYWRVSLAVLGDAPLAGAGAAGFTDEYIRRRHTDKTPLYAHSIWMQTAADLGAVGLALLAGALAALAAAVLRTRSRIAPHDRLVQAAACAPLLYVVAHSSVDWVSHIPVVSVPAIGLAAAAAGLRAEAAPGQPAERTAPRPGPALAAALALVAGALLLAGPPYLSGRLQELAASELAKRPGDALAHLRSAQRVQPLGRAAAVQEGVYALELGDERRAAQAFRTALERDGRSWFAQLEMALLEARGDMRASALRRLALAGRLNPREPWIPRAQAALATRARTPDPLDVARAILSRPG